MLSRAFRLNDGDVFCVMAKSGDRYELKFEGNLFYEVGFNGYEYYETLNEHKFGVNPQYMKTGRVFTIDEMNKLIIGD